MASGKGERQKKKVRKNMPGNTKSRYLLSSNKIFTENSLFDIKNDRC